MIEWVSKPDLRTVRSGAISEHGHRTFTKKEATKSINHHEYLMWIQKYNLILILFIPKSNKFWSYLFLNLISFKTIYLRTLKNIKKEESKSQIIGSNSRATTTYVTQKKTSRKRRLPCVTELFFNSYTYLVESDELICEWDVASQ